MPLDIFCRVFLADNQFHVIMLPAFNAWQADRTRRQGTAADPET
jgi:hypothetical protein